MLQKTLREVIEDNPEIKSLLYSFDYKDRTSTNFRDLSEILESCGFKIIDEEKNIIGEYNGIIGYLGTLVIEI